MNDKNNIFSICSLLLMLFALMFAGYACKSDKAILEEEESATEERTEVLSTEQRVKELRALAESAEVDEKERELIVKQAENLDRAREESPHKERSCESIVEDYIQQVTKYIQTGNSAHYDQAMNFNNDPFFADCRNSNQELRLKIRDARKALSEYIESQ